MKGCHKLSDKALGSTIARLTTLTRLDLSLVPRITTQGVASLSTLTKLEDFRITGCIMVRTEALSALRAPNLRVLDLRGTSIGLSREQVLALFPSVEALAVAADRNLPMGSLDAVK